MAGDQSKKPLSPYEREQERLRREADERQKEVEARKEKFKAAHRKEFEQIVQGQEIHDPEIVNAAADEMARILAEKGANPDNFDWGNHRDIQGEAIGNAIKTVELDRKQQYEKALQDAESLRRKEELRQAQAATPERLQRQFGRYDALRQPPSPRPPSGANGQQPPTPPRGPSGPGNPPPLTNPNQPLSANEVLQRFNDPALQARYQQEQQRSEQSKTSTPETPATPASTIARGNVPGEQQAEAKGKEQAAAKYYAVRDIPDSSRARDNSREGGRGSRGGGRSR